MKKKKEVIVEPAEYNCLCTKCGHNWVSTGKPTKCPNCGSKQITYNKSKGA